MMMGTNGHADELAAARAFLEKSEAGQAVLALLQGVLTKHDLRGLAKSIVPFVKEQTESVRRASFETELNARAFITQTERRVAQLTAEIRQLQKQFTEFKAMRVAEIEQRAAMLELQLSKSLKNGGVWKSATEYEPGDVVTFKGAAWVCQEPNSNERPGTSNVWRLMHKTDGR